MIPEEIIIEFAKTVDMNKPLTSKILSNPT